MNVKRLFDEILLHKSKKEKEEFFQNFIINHPIMKKVIIELMNEIYQGSQNILMIVGPSGVGKSRLFYATINSVLIDMKEELDRNRGIIPITGIELPNPDLGKFNWKDFYYRALSSLKEPLIDYKIEPNYLNDKEEKKNQRVSTAAALRRSLEKACINRHTKAILIDEAQHFFAINSKKRGDSEKNQRQFNSLKSLANMSNTKIVLFGTYDLNAVVNLDGQLSRRVKEIHFPRYDYSLAEDRKHFKSLLNTFQKLIPVEKEPDLIKYSEYIYENCVGCVGILKDWLFRCLSDAIVNDENTISFANIKKNALQTKKLLTLANEALIGEEQFKESKSDQEELSLLLGTKKIVNKEKSKNNAKPGVRKPTRDDVGIEISEV